jgi:high affinity Mn2+ porin
MRARAFLVGCLLVLAVVPTAFAKGPRDLPSEDKPATPINPEAGERELYSFHFQFTAGTQTHPSFPAKYSGPNSMSSKADTATAFVSTLYADVRLWPGAELLFNPEMSGGQGLSQTLGVAAFPSGIVYRVGNPTPSIYIARLALSQTFGLGGGKVVVESAPNELAGKRDKNQLAITVGRLSVTDVFDANRYANDATSGFFNWALFASGAFDYAADTRGYTYGILADLTMNWWSVRGGIALEPYYANLSQMDWRLDQSRALMFEYEVRYHIKKLPGAISVLGFMNTARMGSYEQVLANPSAYGNNVMATRADGRTKLGFALSMEQQLTKTTGAFLRASMNDGDNESWAFTEIDRCLALGVVQSGKLWHRHRDEVGLAFVFSGLSPAHKRYLEGGGVGWIIGDGALNYGAEVEGDFYYKLNLMDNLDASAIYQPIINPAYNQDRGPIHVFSARLHAAF